MSNISLPSIHHISADIKSCKNYVYGCNQAYAEPATLQAHQQSCPFSPRESTRHDSMLSFQRDPHPAMALRLNTRLDSPPSSTSDGDSEGVCTPNVSRAPSLCNTGTTSRRSSLARSQPRRRPSTPMAIPNDTSKKVKKTVKEQANRAQQKAVLCRQEDAILCYFHWSKQEQSAGNGASAGISINKSHLQHIIERFFLENIDAQWRQAALQGRLAEFEESMRAKLEAAVQEDSDPYEGSLMKLPSGEVPCEHRDTKSKVCSVHREADWRECRRRRAEAAFQRNSEEFFRGVGISREEAYFGAEAGREGGGRRR